MTRVSLGRNARNVYNRVTFIDWGIVSSLAAKRFLNQSARKIDGLDVIKIDV